MIYTLQHVKWDKHKSTSSKSALKMLMKLAPGMQKFGKFEV